MKKLTVIVSLLLVVPAVAMAANPVLGPGLQMALDAPERVAGDGEEPGFGAGSVQRGHDRLAIPTVARAAQQGSEVDHGRDEHHVQSKTSGFRYQL